MRRRVSRREAHSVREPIAYARFREIMDGEGAFVYAGWCGRAACEAVIKEETKATIRVLPDPEFRSPEAPRTCLKCERPATRRGPVGEGLLSDRGPRLGGSAAGARAAAAAATRSSPAAAPAPAFPRVRDTVYCEQVPIPAIATTTGTPVYVYSSAGVRSQYRLLEKSFAGVPHRIHYSVKANGNLALLRLLRSLGAGVDIVSGGELFRALRAGYSGQDVVFSGVGKTPGEIRDALAAGVLLINVESDAELDVIEPGRDRGRRDGIRGASRESRGRRCRRRIRISGPGSAAASSAWPPTTSHASPGGPATLPSLRLRGLDMHLGSQIDGAAAVP